MSYPVPREPESPEETKEYFKNLMLRNGRWASTKWRVDPSYFPGLASGQAPKIVWIGCSDSRVLPETLGAFQPGEIFVHRNIANIVHPTDLSVQSILQFAVDSLGVQHIIVCGHTNCGGVVAACTQKDHGPLAHWIRAVRDVARLHHDELSLLEGPERVNRLIELNVIEQARNILKTGVIQAARARNGSNNVPSIHGFVFEIETGRLRPINLGLAEWARKYASLYCIHEGAFDQLEHDDECSEMLLDMIRPRGRVASEGFALEHQCTCNPALANHHPTKVPSAGGPSGATACLLPRRAASALEQDDTPAAPVVGRTPPRTEAHVSFAPSALVPAGSAEEVDIRTIFDEKAAA